MQYVIVDGSNAVVHGPAGWSALPFGLRLREFLEEAGAGIGSVALGNEAPAGVLEWAGCPFRILPCAISGDSYDPSTQILGAPAVTVAEDGQSASAVYSPSDKSLEDVRALRVTETKAEAGRRILNRFPIWKQSNMNMRAGALNDARFSRALTEAEEVEAEALRQAGAWIVAIREDSNAIEAWINADGRTVADLRSMAGSPGWTE